MAHTGGPLLPLREQVHTQVSGTSRYQYSMYSCCCAFFQLKPLSFPKLCRTIKYKNKHDRLSKSNTIISTAPEKGADVLLCLTTFPPQAVEHCEMRAGRTTACCNLVRFGRTRVGIPPISLHQVEMIGYFRFFGEKNSSKQSCNLSYRT